MCRFWISIGDYCINSPAKNKLKIELDYLFKKGGPDFQKIETSDSVTAYHSRLSIQDLSEKSNQPLVNKDGDIFIFNGEIFNWPDLLRELPQDKINEEIKSDTQFLFFLLTNEYFEKFAKRIRGFFAFVFSPLKKNIFLMLEIVLG